MKNKMSNIKYSKEVMKNFLHPKNIGEIKNPDGVGKIGNPVCGDVMWVYIKVKDDKIKHIKFKTFGCVAAIATSSVLTQLAKGKTIKQAGKIRTKDIVKSLKGLPSIKVHCSTLASKALKLAIKNYKNKNDKKLKDKF